MDQRDNSLFFRNKLLKIHREDATKIVSKLELCIAYNVYAPHFREES